MILEIKVKGIETYFKLHLYRNMNEDHSKLALAAEENGIIGFG